ncbi:hypothetical protein QFC21_002948 [Naganishia friedmannii]|uniref:Uncharacterized protein n=1 Tax=Naganishia friedmannii TaxID=89922 RepID=A0ACC2VT88_9TREE|nr:hypothetical protein QFC21_002948 [Naganishia friedmannii]
MPEEDIHTVEKQAWDDKWRAKNTPWDKSAPHGALLQLLKESGTDDVPAIPKDGLALVPGCGKGYDVLLLAQRGLDATGLDVSPIAVEQANEYLEEQQASSPLNHKTEVKLASFFDWKRPIDGYSVIYDYTQDWEMVFQRDVKKEESRFDGDSFKQGREKIAVWKRRA